MHPPRVDHILLDARTSARDLDALVATVRSDPHPLKGIVIPPFFARRAVDGLRNTGIRIASVAGYPTGLSKPTIKAIEATSLAKDGVHAVELTPLLANILERNFEALRAELLEVVRGVRAARPTTSVHVRLDLDAIGHDLLPDLIATIVRGACDGVVLEAVADATLHDALARLPGDMTIECKIVAAGTFEHAGKTPIAVGRRHELIHRG